MFQQARLKLTGWYLLIIMMISAFFSLGIYFTVSSQLERSFYQAEIRYRRQIDPDFGRGSNGLGQRIEDLPPSLVQGQAFFTLQDLQTAKQKFALGLVMANGIILFVSALSGYFLAGKTLLPIEQVMEGQKRFIADASHELKTPLTALKTVLEVTLRQKRLTLKESRQTINDSLEEVRELEVLSSWLLKLAQLQEGRLEKDSFDLADLVRKTVGRFKILADKKKIKLTVKTDKIILLVDKQKIKEMIGIFLDNAIKYTPQKGRVDVRLVKLRGRCRCRLQIKDSGIGIDKKDLPHVFKRFYRTDASRTRGTAGGFGLGLSLAKQIVDLHHGRIEVNSKLGEGTVFNVVF